MLTRVTISLSHDWADAMSSNSKVLLPAKRVVAARRVIGDAVKSKSTITLARDHVSHFLWDE